MASTYATIEQSRWKTVNDWAGYLVFGLPAALAFPALAATVARFGVRDTVTGAVPAALSACIPLLLWARYARRPPRSRTGRFTWAVVAMALLATLVLSPLFFWAAPAVGVLTSELLRFLLSARPAPTSQR